MNVHEQRAFELQRQCDARSALCRLQHEEAAIRRRLVSIEDERASWSRRLVEAEARLAELRHQEPTR